MALQEKNRVKRCCALLAALATGCHLGPHYEEPQVKTPEHWQSPSPQESSVSLAQWWTLFNDPVLSELVDILLSDSYDLRMAAQRLLEAQADARIQGSKRWPTLDARASSQQAVPGGFAAVGAAATPTPTPGPDPTPSPAAASSTTSPFDVTLTRHTAGIAISWELDLFGRVQRQLEAAEAHVQALAFDAESIRISLLGQLGAHYFNYRAQQQLFSSIAEEIDLVSEQEKRYYQRAERGLDSADLADGISALKRGLQQQSAQLQSSLSQSAYRITTLLGKVPGELDTLLKPSSKLPQIPDSIAIGLPADLTKRRPDVRSAERQLAQAVAMEGAALAQRFPQLKLMGAGGFDTLRLDQMRWNGMSWSYGASLLSPLIHAGRLRAQVQSRSAASQQASLNYERALLGALEEVESALTRFHSAKTQWEAQTEALAARERQYAHAKRKQDAGILSELQVLEKRRQLLQAQRQETSNLGNTLQELVVLFRALGGGFGDEA